MTGFESITYIRPRFAFSVLYTPDQVLARITRRLKDSHAPVVGHVIDNHVVLDVPQRDRHYWSPQLNFRVEPDEEMPHHSMVRGLIGPRPAVWTLFMFIYFSVGATGFFVSAFGVSRWMLGEFSYLVLALPLAILIMLTAYRAGKLGERLGADQVDVLKEFVRDALASNL